MTGQNPSSAILLIMGQFNYTMSLKPEFFKVCILRRGYLLIEGHEESILTKIRKSKDFDESVVKAVEELKKSSIKQLWSEE